MKNGFTLVELSIVLVIIGLLISGILIAENIIESAKVNAQVSQITEFDAAVSAFESKFRQIPGDSKFHGGDGDGAVEGNNAFTCCGWNGNVHMYSGEIANFWAQAFPDEYIGGTYTTNNTVIDPITISGSGKTVPKSKMGHDNSALIASKTLTSLDNYYSIVNLDNQTSYNTNGGFTRFNSSYLGNMSLKPIELLSLDKKIDDSKANSGNVLSGSYRHNNWGGMAELVPYLTNCSSGENYSISDDNYKCTPFIRIGATSGNLK